MTDPPPLDRATWELREPGWPHPVRGDTRVPAGTEPDTAIVICHGFKGFRTWGFFPSLARTAALRGHLAVTFDFSCNGVGPDGVDFSALDAFARNTHSRNVAEIGRVVDALLGGELGAPSPSRVALLGHSRGGAEALLAAQQNGRIGALVTWAAVSTFHRWNEEDMRTWQEGGVVRIRNARTGQDMPVGSGYWEDLLANADRLDVLAAAEALSVPWLIVHGTEDGSVPVEEARALHRAAGSGASLLEIEGGGHTFGAAHPFGGTTPQLTRAVRASLEWIEETM